MNALWLHLAVGHRWDKEFGPIHVGVFDIDNIKPLIFLCSYTHTTTYNARFRWILSMLRPLN
jgi:hypothetical protein